MQPENKSKYACRTAGYATVNGLSKSYINPIRTVPDITLPKRRNDNDNGTANSPIRLIGNKNHIGWNNKVLNPVLLDTIKLNQYKCYQTKTQSNTIISRWWS